VEVKRIFGKRWANLDFYGCIVAVLSGLINGRSIGEWKANINKVTVPGHWCMLQ
jgi:hypothetical protein